MSTSSDISPSKAKNDLCSNRKILALFWGQHWGDCWEMGLSAHWPFWALRCHVELKLKPPAVILCLILFASVCVYFHNSFFFCISCKISGFCHFWVRLRMGPLFNPTLEVVTFCLTHFHNDLTNCVIILNVYIFVNKYMLILAVSWSSVCMTLHDACPFLHISFVAVVFCANIFCIWLMVPFCHMWIILYF